MAKTITLDGPAGAGKSSIAHIFANKIGYQYIESGLIYRAISYFLMEKKISDKDNEKIKSALQDLKISLTDDGITLNDENINHLLREEKIDKAVSLYAAIQEIRDYVRTLQHSFASNRDSLVEGRDIGTIVFPSAFCKFYLDANVEIRAQRRFEELKGRGVQSSLEEIRRKIIERDKTDRQRKKSPLAIPNDAFFIDTSAMTKEQVVDEMLRLFNKKNELLQEKGDDAKKDFEKAIDLYHHKEYAKGDVLNVKIISVKEKITVNLGEKIEAFISEAETKKLKKQNLKEGDEISVAIVSQSDHDIVVSKIAVDIKKKQGELKKKFEKKEPVQGVVKAFFEDKKGFSVSLYGVKAFCPLEEYGSREKNNPKNQIGKYFLFEITSYDSQPMLVSRRSVWKRIQDKNREEFYHSVQVGDVINVKVTDIRNYGAIVKIKDGVNSLLHNEEIAWEKITKKNIPFKVGDTLDVKVTQIDHEAHRIEISKKQLTGDPFFAFIEKHFQNDILNVKVTNIENFGAFVQIVPGVHGLIHISDLSWSRNVKHPKEVIKKNDEVEAVILDINKEKRQVRLGLKQLQENPWSKVDEICQPNCIISAKVYKVTPQSVYCTIDGTINAEVYYKNCHFAEDEPNFDFTQKVKVEDEIKARVIKINRNFHKVDLEMIEENENYWETLKINMKKFIPLKGIATEIVEKGINIKINEEITGFCHISQFDLQETKSIENLVEIGKEYLFLIQSLNEEKKKVNLSRKDYLERYEKKQAKNNSDYPSGNTITLGQIIEK